MRLALFRSMWSAPEDWTLLFQQTKHAGFDGIEGPPPSIGMGALPFMKTASGQVFGQAFGQISDVQQSRLTFKTMLNDHDLAYIAEATTGVDLAYCQQAGVDWWVPAPYKTPEDHIDDLSATIDAAIACDAIQVTAMTGYDAWPLSQQIDFFGQALDLVESAPIDVSFETHRCRSLFNPWVTRDLLAQLPKLPLTIDFSHWCVVCERLIDSEWAIIEACAQQAIHIHGRVGYAQKAQVPDLRPPVQPVYERALQAHENWWDVIWNRQAERGLKQSTMTIEFGAEGYWQTDPVTGEAYIDLWPLIQWMGQRQKTRFLEQDWQTN